LRCCSKIIRKNPVAVKGVHGAGKQASRMNPAAVKPVHDAGNQE